MITSSEEKLVVSHSLNKNSSGETEMCGSILCCRKAPPHTELNAEQTGLTPSTDDDDDVDEART